MVYKYKEKFKKSFKKAVLNCKDFIIVESVWALNLETESDVSVVAAVNTVDLLVAHGDETQLPGRALL